MPRINVMVNGLPGNMATNVARHALRDERFHLVACSFTGPEITIAETTLEGVRIRLIPPDRQAQATAEIKASEGAYITVDYTHPSAVNANAEFYCAHALPFVMGTTGGDRERLLAAVCAASIPAVIAPNMAKQIVAFQAMIAYAARTFPGLFKGYTLQVKESHQKGKADVSGTARALVQHFNALGIPFTETDIVMQRDPEVQKKNWGVPEAHLKGHGWHTYTFLAADGTVKIEFTHNVNGRDVYVQGTLDAAAYLSTKVSQPAPGRAYSMMDVLSGT